MLTFLKKIDWKLLLVGAAAVIVISDIALNWYTEKYHPEGTYIEIFGGMLALPPGYAFDMPHYKRTKEARFSRYLKPSALVLVGPYSDLKPDFLDYVQQHKTSESHPCKVRLIHGADGEISFTLLHNSNDYMFLSGAPEEDTAFAVRVLCQLHPGKT